MVWWSVVPCLMFSRAQEYPVLSINKCITYWHGYCVPIVIILARLMIMMKLQVFLANWCPFICFNWTMQYAIKKIVFLLLWLGGNWETQLEHLASLICFVLPLNQVTRLGTTREDFFVGWNIENLKIYAIIVGHVDDDDENVCVVQLSPTSIILLLAISLFILFLSLLPKPFYTRQPF